MAQDVKRAEPGSLPQARYYDPFMQMRSEMDRVLNSFLGRDVARWPFAGGEGTAVAAPSVDIRETAKEYLVEAELPGLDEKDVSVTLREGILTLKGEKRAEREEKKADYHLSERSYGSFVRSFNLGDTVDSDKVSATFEKGVLKVTLPKHAEAARTERQIPIGKR